jgi:hypothetical protein
MKMSFGFFDKNFNGKVLGPPPKIFAEIDHKFCRHNVHDPSKMFVENFEDEALQLWLLWIICS